MKNFYALIIDVVSSRGLSTEDRFDVQKKLDSAIIVVNKMFKEWIVKSLGFSAGDSVQGLFATISSAYEAYLLINSSVFPHEIRAGIGRGAINHMILDVFQDNDSNRFDGHAYHLARTAVDLAKKTKSNLVIKTEQHYDGMINPIIDDEEIISKTLARMAIYSLVNLIDPIIDGQFTCDIECLNFNVPLITSIANFYREKSKVNNPVLIKGHHDDGSHDKLEESQANTYLQEYFSDGIINKNKENSSTISTPMRTLLVALTGSTEQNTNSLINTSRVDNLRKRNVAKIRILKKFYEEDK